jgi:predicted O-methyltransferase YrrM
MSRFWLLQQYIKWYFTAKNLHGTHSPFMYSFLDSCLNKAHDKKLFRDIEDRRKELKKNTTILHYTDPGAGNRNKNEPSITQRKVSTIARNSLQPQRYGLLFNSMISYFEIENVLELGTSLGITSAYMSRANQSVSIDTIEGAKEVAALARETFLKLNCNNISLHIGTFDEILPTLLNGKRQFQMVFIDGDHKGLSLLKYFNQIVKHIPEHGVIVVDDIRWSRSMFDAWNQIKKHPDVQITVDLFNMGLVFLKQGLSKENFMIKFKNNKH